MKTVVMTGGTSGLGAIAAERMLASSQVRLLLGGRRAGPTGAELVEVDLASLDSVRRFARSVGDRVGPDPIDALVLNAGRSGAASGPTIDGFEPTFAVNHLAHYLLFRLLEERLATRAIVVLTTSSTHDPRAGAPLPAPRHANARLLAYPETDSDLPASPRAAHGHAYTASKLCNILTARGAIAHAQATGREWRVVAYDPGRTPGTGLMRDQGRLVDVLWRLLGAGPLQRLVPGANTRESSGATLAALAIGEVTVPPVEYYASLRRSGLEWHAPSELARQDDAMTALWRDSAGLVGLSEALETGAA